MALPEGDELVERLSGLGADWAALVESLAAACQQAGQPLSLAALLFALRDIPYGPPQGEDTAQAVLAQWRGTGEGKHLLAHSALDRLALKPRFWMAQYRLSAEAAWLPAALRERLPALGVWDVHHFLTAELLGRTCRIDLTWPVSLAAEGLPTTRHWAPGRDFSVAVVSALAVPVPVAEMPRRKRDWLEALNGDEAALHQEAVAELTAFVEAHQPCPALREALVRSVASLYP